MECDLCDQPIVYDSKQFCTKCERSSGGVSNSTEQNTTQQYKSIQQPSVEPGATENQSVSPDGLTYIYRFALVNTLQGGLFALAFEWTFNNPVVMTQTSSEFGTHYQLQTLGPAYLIISGFFAAVFGFVAAGLWKQKRVFWYLGVAINVLALVLALIPPPTWWWVLLCGLALYWAYRSYDPIQTVV